MTTATVVSAETIVRAYYDAVNRADWAALDGLVSADYDHHTPHLPRGREPFKQMLALYRRGFPDLVNDIQEIITGDGGDGDGGDRIIVRTRTSGTHRAPFLGHAATNRRFSAHGIDIFRIVDGQIVACHAVFDTFTMLQQLGLHRPVQG